MNICVIGTGYVGLVTGTVFADLGNEVICVDTDESKVRRLRQGVMPIYEPGLEELVARNVSDGRLCFTTEAEAGIEHADVVFICVGTPPGENGEPDMRQVDEAAHAIARSLNRYKVIVNKSTVPIGTGERVREIISVNRRRNVDFDVVSNPEFLREGSAIADTLHPDRIVIGAPSQAVAMRILELYAPLERPMVITDVVSAELIKYASNAYLAMRISFVNFVGQVCEATGADVVQVAKGMGYDSRIGSGFLAAGLGYGGSCFPKDTLALTRTAERLGCKTDILDAVVNINETQPNRFVERMDERLEGLAGRVVAVLGLAFKGNTDDLRDSRALVVIRRLQDAGAEIRAYDPIAMPKAREILDGVHFAESAYDAARGADAVAVVTEWNEFRQLNLARLKECMRGAALFDGRNLYDPARVRRAGLNYYGMGRPDADQPLREDGV